MKYFLLLISGLFTYSFVFSQTPEDALRYSMRSEEGGTARVQALGGASISLGGEFTNLFENPAGLGFFKTGDVLLTPSMLFNSNSSEYLGQSGMTNNNKLSLGASGALFVNEFQNKRLKNLTIGIGLNRTANFNNRISYSGKNTKNSFSDQYLDEFIDNHVTDENQANSGFPFGSSLAYRTFLINPTFDANGKVDGYFSLADPSMGLGQKMIRHTSGGIDDIALGMGLNFQERFYVGGTLSFYSLHYLGKSNYTENDLSGNTNNDFNFFSADEYLSTIGTGVQAKLGMIFRPTNDLQLGLTFHTPTFFQMTDHYNMTITTDPEGFQGQSTPTVSSTDLNNGNLLRTTYNLVTPLKVGIGGTYFISRGEEIKEQKGFITADIEYTSYDRTHFKDANHDASAKEYYGQVNDVIRDIYKPVFNARLGAEIKMDLIMFRLGGAFYGNPYKDYSANTYKGTAGIGYRTAAYYIDLAYTYAFNKDRDYPYRLDPPATVAPAELTNHGSNVALTIGFKLRN